MAKIEVDGVTYEVRDGTNLLNACLSQGLDLPYFCWHPSLGSVGACRQCAVVQYKDADDTHGKLTMACMTPASDGARLSIRAEEAVRFRASVIEWLMLNHPHDCPVCEEGGECHLQDMTVMTGHTFRRYRGSKRTFRNQYLGPFINHEMNRCITCYRCVRFYRDYAGGRDLDAFGSRDRLYFGRAEDGVLDSEFAGNLVEVCPTGVFTDRPFSATYTRKWDLTSAPSLCHGCALGCNTLPGERYGTLKRVHNRYHHEVNGYFLCDRGRFGAGFVNSPRRLRHAGARRDDGVFDEIPGDEAVRRAGASLRRGGVVGIGSPRASLETNFVLQSLVGRENFCPGFGDHDGAVMAALTAELAGSGVHIATLAEVELADAVLVLGEDVSNTAPRLALALRQTVRNASFELAAGANIPSWQDAGVRGHGGHRLTPLLQATPLSTRLDDVTTRSVHHVPAELARTGFAIAGRLGGANPVPDDLDDELQAFADEAAQVLRAARRPLIVSGSGCGSASVVHAAGAIAAALDGAGLEVALSLNGTECNALGSCLLGGGLELEDVVTRVARGRADTVLIAENDLSRRGEIAGLRRALEGAAVIVLDSIESWIAEQADLVLPAATFAESDGTWVNGEGRAQRFYRVFPGAGEIAPSWHWLARIGAAAGGEWADRVSGCAHVDEVLGLLARERPDLAEAAHAGPGAGTLQRAGTRVPRQPHRYSGRTAIHAAESVHEPRTPDDEEAPLRFSMEGYRPQDPGALLSYAWSPGWNSNQSVYKFQAEVAGPLRGGPAGVRLVLGEAAGVQAPGSVAMPPAFGKTAPAEPGAAASRARLVAVPLHDAFGSDELSALAPAMAARAPAPCVVLSMADAQGLGVASGEGVRLATRDGRSSFLVRLDEGMRPGAVGFVQGMTNDLFLVPGSTVEVTADPDYVPPTDRVIARG